MFTVWFDGMDWDTTRAAAIIKSGKVYTEGKGSGLIFQDYSAGGSAQFGYCVTSPTHDESTPDVDAQTVTIPKSSLARRLRRSDRGAKPVDSGRPPGPWLPERPVRQHRRQDRRRETLAA